MKEQVGDYIVYIILTIFMLFMVFRMELIKEDNRKMSARVAALQPIKCPKHIVNGRKPNDEYLCWREIL